MKNTTHKVIRGTAALALAVGGLTAVSAPAVAGEIFGWDPRNTICYYFPYWCD